MRSNKLNALDQNLQTLGLSLPTSITKHREQLTELSAIPSHEGKRSIKDIDDIKSAVEARALDALIARERVNQVRLLSDDINQAIDRALIRSTEDIIEMLKPKVMEAHKAIQEAAQKLGQVTTEAAVKANNVKAYKAAEEAWEVLATACAIREALYTLDRPSLEAGNVRALTLFRFTSLAAWNTYGQLPDAGSGVGNHAATLATHGIEPAWLSTDDAEAQSRRAR
jgi:hypothetical protein